MKRIAIFQYEWPLQSHTVNFAKSLAMMEYAVDLYFKRCATNLIDLAVLGRVPNVRVIDLDHFSPSCLSPFVFLFSKVWKIFELALQRFMFAPLMWPVLIQSYSFFQSNNYDCLIGVEKKGMIWAGMTSRVTGVPYIYYSLELYDENHPYFFNMPGFPALRRAEIFFHKRALATIVQDLQRGAYLMQSNSISNTEMIYLPVSVPGEPITEPGNFFEARFSIPRNVPIVLFLGLIEESRHCLEIARTSRKNSGQFVLAFHGYGEAGIIDKIREEGGASVIISTALVAEELIPQVVASARVGLAIYRNDCANDHLTAFSSEKVAFYCRAGIPFIAFNTESYRSLKDRFDCCVLVGGIEEIPSAVAEILRNYEKYRSNAFRAFNVCYRYTTNITSATKSIRKLLASREESPC